MARDGRGHCSDNRLGAGCPELARRSTLPSCPIFLRADPMTTTAAALNPATESPLDPIAGIGQRAGGPNATPHPAGPALGNHTTHGSSHMGNDMMQSLILAMY